MKTVTPARIRRLEALLADARRVCIVVHTHPDGDAVGSGAALLAYLRGCRGLAAELILPDPAAGILDFLLPENGVTLASEDPTGARSIIAGCDLLFCLDMNGPGRAGDLEEPLRAVSARKVLVDHHPHPDSDWFDLMFSETEVSSASELLYRVLLALPGAGRAERLPLEVLTPLMAGMTTDTNNFANSVYPSTLRMASELLAAGVDRDALLDALFNSYGESRFRAMGCFLDRLMHITDDGVAYAILDRSTQEAFGIREGDTEGFVNLPLGIGRVRMSLFLREDDGHFRVSIRSKRGVAANRLAAEAFHGGGHECAAGGKLFFPQDIPAREQAAQYIETVTARFMRNEAPSQDR